MTSRVRIPSLPPSDWGEAEREAYAVQAAAFGVEIEPRFESSEHPLS